MEEARPVVTKKNSRTYVFMTWGKVGAKRFVIGIYKVTRDMIHKLNRSRKRE
jgi:hypothetical protein